MLTGMSNGALIAFILLAVATLVLWVILPFAVFGIKGRLDKMLKVLEDIRDEARQRAVNDAARGAAKAPEE
jgi:uncharacterized protein YoxC